MAKRVKSATKRGRATSKLQKPANSELVTLLDFVRYAVSRFVKAKLTFAHGTTDPVAEAAFLVCEALRLHPDQFETFAMAHVTAAEGKECLDLVERRVASRKPAAYLVNKIYMRGLPFYVDERVIVPRSFIGELLDSHFDGGDADPAEIKSVLDLCTGSGCLAVLASRRFPNAQIDAVDISKDAIEVAARNIADHGLEDQGRALSRRPVRAARRQALRLDHLQSALCRCERHGGPAAGMPRRAETRLRRRPRRARCRPAHPRRGRTHLTPRGGLLCEIGRGRENLEAAYPQLPLLWLDTEQSEGEVFWIGAADLAS